MQIIPAIDIFENQCVRLTGGVFASRKDYSLDPYEMARTFVRAGASHLHIVDLEGAKDGRVVNWSSIEKILSLEDVAVQVGGGIRTEEEIERLIGLGAKRIIIGSIAVRSQELFYSWVKRFSPKLFCVALDLKDGKLAFEGWQQFDSSDLPGVILRMIDLGIDRVLSTDIRRDGLLAGPNLDLYRKLIGDFPAVEWIASGGVRSEEDVQALEEAGVAGVIIGKALYEGKIKLNELLIRYQRDSGRQIPGPAGRDGAKS